jgi:hypothetical protein
MRPSEFRITVVNAAKSTSFNGRCFNASLIDEEISMAALTTVIVKVGCARCTEFLVSYSSQRNKSRCVLPRSQDFNQICETKVVDEMIVRTIEITATNSYCDTIVTMLSAMISTMVTITTEIGNRQQKLAQL